MVHLKRRSRRILPLLLLCFLCLYMDNVDNTRHILMVQIVQALYVSYEHMNLYKVGDRVNILASKLTSPVTFAPFDYNKFPICMESSSNNIPFASSTLPLNSSNRWNKAMAALHGDAYYSENSISITFGYDLFCAKSCSYTLQDSTRLQTYKDLVENEYSYNIYIDGLPASYKTETDETMSTIYWGGIPVGNKKEDLMNVNTRYNFTSNEDTGDETKLINNHWNIHIWYRPSKDTVDSYAIVQVSIEPFSVQQEYISPLTGTATKMASCDANNEPVHTSFDTILDIPVQQLTSTAPISFTYDVIWTEAPDNLSYNKRWNIYLSMNNAIPNYVEFAGFFLGGFIFVSLTGILCTWVLRDLSYKPIIDESHEDDNESTISHQTVQAEVQMWPLSTRIFFPPTYGRLLLCIGCGSGAQLFLTSFFYIILLRVGIISQSQGARVITPGAILYCLCSVSGGYVTARLYALFHGDFKIALALCLLTAIAYPLIGIFVAYIAYDILPGSNAPEYNVSSNIAPLIILWIFLIWPITVAGGYVGYRGGPIQNFPVSEGSAGYHDLNLQNDRKKESDQENRSRQYMFSTCIKKHRILILLLTGGFLPILSCFVNYSYGVAGPILLGYYSVRSYMISSFVLFFLISGVQAVLLFYRQIRTQRSFEWWWATFSAAGSAGIYVYILSISYLLFRGDESNVKGTTILQYMIWFAFTSFGVFLMTGFMGVALNILFIRRLYTYIMNRQH